MDENQKNMGLHIWYNQYNPLHQRFLNTAQVGFFHQNPPSKIFEPLEVNRWVYGDHGDYNQS